MGPLYLTNFNLDLFLVFLYPIFDFFDLFVLLSFFFGEFLFLLLGLRSDKTLLTLLESRLLLLLDYTIGAKLFFDYSFQFLNGVGYPGVKSYISFQILGQVPNFQFMSSVWSPKMLTLESVRTKTKTSRGCKSSCIFIEVVLLCPIL
jgi:hypothetical protein